MLSPSKQFLNEYKGLVVKMVIDNVNVQITKANYEFLCDAKTLLGLACVIPLLEVVQGLSKFAQGRGTFIYDCVDALKLVETNLLQCTMKVHQSFHINNLVSLKLNMLPFILVESFICYISEIKPQRS